MIAPARRRSGGLESGGNPWAPWMFVDLATVFAVSVLSVIGVVMVYSATRGTDAAAYDTSYLQRQLAFSMVGAALMAGTVLIPTDRVRAMAPLFYGMGLIGLIAVLSPLGVNRNGAQAWFEVAGFQLQPSEPLKVADIVLLASYVSRFDGDLTASQLGSALMIGGLPLALIMQQPDLGTGLVYISITMGVLLIGGARARHIVALTMVGLIGVLGVWNLGMLDEYQEDRLISFIDPESNQTAAAWQQTQSQLAIGSGGVTGQGWGQGDQTRGEFVPEQHTDFIFAVIGEELGFLGGSLVLTMFGLLIWRVWRTASKAADLFGSLVCAGVMTMLVFQMFQAIGMTTGIMPITGIPVPFLSYGGSSALTTYVAVGLVLNIHMRRHGLSR